MAFANPPNYSPFLSPPTAPFTPQATDLGTALRAVQSTQQFMADEEARKVEQGQKSQQLAENARSNRATEGYNRGTLDLQRSMFQRKLELEKKESEAEKKKQIDALLAELDFAQKSKNSVRVNEVKEKLKRHGLSVQEIEEAATPAAPPQYTTIDDTGETNAPPPPVDIDFDEPFSGDPPSAHNTERINLDEPTETDPVLGLPLASAGASPARLPSTAPSRVGSKRLEIRDASGNVVHTTPQSQFGDSVRLVDQGLKPIIDGAPEYGKEAAAEAARYGAVLAESGLTPDEAMDKAISLYKWRLGEIEKTRRTELNGIGGGGGAGLGGDKMSAMQFRFHNTQVNQKYKVAGINEALSDLDSAEAAIRGAQGGVGDIAAVTSVLKSLQGRISNYDMEQFIGAGGLMSQLNSLSGRVFGKGEIDPQYMQQVQLLIQQFRRVLTQKKQEAARVLQEQINNDPFISPEAKSQLQNWGGTAYGGGSGGEPSTDELLENAD